MKKLICLALLVVGVIGELLILINSIILRFKFPDMTEMRFMLSFPEQNILCIVFFIMLIISYVIMIRSDK